MQRRDELPPAQHEQPLGQLREGITCFDERLAESGDAKSPAGGAVRPALRLPPKFVQWFALPAAHVLRPVVFYAVIEGFVAYTNSFDSLTLNDEVAAARFFCMLFLCASAWLIPMHAFLLVATLNFADESRKIRLLKVAGWALAWAVLIFVVPLLVRSASHERPPILWNR